MASLKELDSPFKPYPRAEIVESPFLQLKLAKLDSRDQDTWIAEARLRPASTRGAISGYGASMGVMNNVSDQRYHNNAVDERKDREMGNLSIQIRTVFSTIGTWINVYLTNLLFRNRVRYTSSR